jgi:hypothetical protein
MYNIASCNFLLVITDSEHGKYLNFFKPSADGQSFKRAKSSWLFKQRYKKSMKGGQLSFQAPWPGISWKLKQMQGGAHEKGH